ncbi:MAG: efflux RND transporter permease subunit, partial [Phycisphaerae bacterium]
MKLGKTLVETSIHHYKAVAVVTVLVTLAIAATAALPSLFPRQFAPLNGVTVDTDPENMLSHEEPVRVFHDRMKERLALHDIIVVGIVNEQQGIANPLSLRRTYELSQYIASLQWRKPDQPGQWEGVIRKDMIAPSVVDKSIPKGGEISFSWFMQEPPKTKQQAEDIVREAKRIPFLDGTLISEDRQAVAIYVPITRKKLSYRVYSDLQKRIPLIWQWAKVAQEIHTAESLDESQKDALIRAGRLVAYEAGSEEAFDTRIRDLLKRAGDPKAWSTLIEPLQGLRDEAQKRAAQREKTLQAEASEMDENQQALARADHAAEARQWIIGRIKADQPGNLAAYYVRSLDQTERFEDQLLSGTIDFLRNLSTDMPTGDISSVTGPALARLDEQREPADAFHITGLPVAEDTFGVEMFKQMAISAPTAMLVIFVLMMVFFRKLIIVISPMIVAMVSVIFTMGSLIIAGFPIHIMSSMIPIFIMPIAVLDSIHIISEFFEKYQETRDRAKTIRAVMDDLFVPMLYTSLTSSAGFASLALTPIPPVQVFGVFVAVGIMVAWLLTVTFIPSFIMFIPEKRLENFGSKHRHHEGEEAGWLINLLHWMGGMTYRRTKPILAAAMVVLVIAGWGISQINVNDNPVKWFGESHPIRIADNVLNEHFGGTYMAYLSIHADEPGWDTERAISEFRAAVEEAMAGTTTAPAEHAVLDDALAAAERITGESESYAGFYQKLSDYVGRKRRGTSEQPSTPNTDNGGPALPGGLDSGSGSGPSLPGGLDDSADGGPALPEGIGSEATAPEAQETPAELWNTIADAIDRKRLELQYFKKPRALQHLTGLQKVLEGREQVGKSNSLADIVKTVYRDLTAEEPRYDIVPQKDPQFRLPDTKEGVGTAIMQFQQSHRPWDLDHFVTNDYQTASIWVQLTSGDNQDMEQVVRTVNAYTTAVDMHRILGSDAVQQLATEPSDARQAIRSRVNELQNRSDADDNTREKVAMYNALLETDSDRLETLLSMPVTVVPDRSLRHKWFGLTYINIVWQDKMV